MASRLGFWYVLLALAVVTLVGGALVVSWGYFFGWFLVLAGACNAVAAASWVVRLRRGETGSR